MPGNIFEFFFDLAEIFTKKRKLSTESVESQNFPGIVSLKSMTFHSIIYRKFKLSEKGNSFLRITHGKSELSADYPADRQNFPWIILRKNLTKSDQYYPRFVKKIIKNMCSTVRAQIFPPICEKI